MMVCTRMERNGLIEEIFKSKINDQWQFGNGSGSEREMKEISRFLTYATPLKVVSFIVVRELQRRSRPGSRCVYDDHGSGLGQFELEVS